MLWAGDSRVKLLANVEHYGGDVGLLTVTAPGVDGVTYWAQGEDGWVDVPDWRVHRIPWADDTRKRACAEAAARWNRTAPRRWRALHRAASQRARRHGFTLVSRTWEYQVRGLLHVHVVVGMNSARERAAAHLYALALDKLRERYGFGFVSDSRRGGSWRSKGLEVIPAQRAARYVAKYLSPLGRDGKPTLSETVTKRDVPPHVIYVSRRLTGATGMTMRYLRWRRKAYMLGLQPIHPVTGELLDSIADRGATGELRAFLAIRQTDT